MILWATLLVIVLPRHHPHLVGVGLAPAHRAERGEGANYGATIGAIARSLLSVTF